MKYIVLLMIFAVSAFSTVLSSADAVPQAKGSWCETFDKAGKNGIPENWKEEGRKLGVPMSVCKVNKTDNSSVLQVKCNKSTGGIIIAPDVDLKKTPVMRWRWRLLNYPNGADGRDPKKDDQPIGIYLGVNDGMFKKKSIAYRWEDITPKDFEGATSYAGILTVNFIVARNNKTSAGEWVTETRNVADDFKRIYGSVPRKFALSVIGNSQYTQSNTVAELDFIEFIPAK